MSKSIYTKQAAAFRIEHATERGLGQLDRLIDRAEELSKKLRDCRAAAQSETTAGLADILLFAINDVENFIRNVNPDMTARAYGDLREADTLSKLMESLPDA